MFDYNSYKQQIMLEYNSLFNKYASLNDSYSLNVRLLYMDTDNSDWDNIGGSLGLWDKKLSQLTWKIYENVPLFQNAPAVTQFDPHQTIESSQSFTATIKFLIVPKPNDLLMFYDDNSNTVYRITDIRFHRSIENILNIFECDFESAPLKADSLYDKINVESHQYYNVFNSKLYDFDTWMTDYQPILDSVSSITVNANIYFDFKNERYTINEFNSLISDLKSNSKLGSITDLKTPFTECDSSCLDLSSAGAQAQNLYDKLNKLKEITC